MHADFRKSPNLPKRTLIQLAEEAARCTREYLMQARRRSIIPESHHGRDIKLSEDRVSEKMIRFVLESKSDIPVLGEEGGWGNTTQVVAGGLADNLHWVVDPLDGSFNFFRGIPLFAVSVALCQGDVPLFGVVYDPERDEAFCGGAAYGLMVNGQRLCAPRERDDGHHTRAASGVAGPRGGAQARPDPLPKALLKGLPRGIPEGSLDSGMEAARSRRQILATGFPTQSAPDAVLEDLRDAARDWRKFRMLGSAALSLAWVAAGRLDGYAEAGIMWWDVAAGLALVEGAAARQMECVSMPPLPETPAHLAPYLRRVRVER